MAAGVQLPLSGKLSPLEIVSVKHELEVWRFLRQLNIVLPKDPAIPLPGREPKEWKTGIQRKNRMPMFVAALFRIATR